MFKKNKLTSKKDKSSTKKDKSSTKVKSSKKKVKSSLRSQLEKQLEKQLRLATKNNDECVLDACENTKHFKKTVKPLNYCNKKFKDDKRKVNRCYAKYLYNVSSNNQGYYNPYNGCNYNCNDTYEKYSRIQDKFKYIDDIYGKKIIKLKDMSDNLSDEFKKCKADKCGHIYPFDQLEKDKQRCDDEINNLSMKGLPISLDVIESKKKSCYEKNKIDVNQENINKCSVENCNNLEQKNNIITDMLMTYSDRDNNTFFSAVKKVSKKKPLDKAKISKRIKKLESEYAFLEKNVKKHF